MADSEVEVAPFVVEEVEGIQASGGAESSQLDESAAASDEIVPAASNHKRKLEDLEPSDHTEGAPAKKQEVSTEIPSLAAADPGSGDDEVAGGTSVEDSVGSIPTATVKVEPTTVSSMVYGLGFSHISSITNVPSQGIPNLQNSSPSYSSQGMNANIDATQEIKPLLNPLSQPLRPAVLAPANANILNTISQHQTPVAVHMGNMISSGMASSAHSAISSVLGSGPPTAMSQIAQNSPLGSLASVNSNLGGNSSIGIPHTLNSLQGNMTIGLSASNVGQGTLTSGAQISQVGITINQNMMNNLVSSSVASMPGTMIQTPGMSQQPGSHSLEIANNTAINMPLVQQAPTVQQSQSKYVKIWEGSLSGQRKGQPVFICKLEGYRSQTASDSLAEDWPPTMQIVRLLAQEHMNNKQYVGKADFLVFRTLNQHGFLEQLREKKLCAVIQLPSQTLLLSVFDHKAHRLIGMLFPGDIAAFKPQVSSQRRQQQQLQWLQPQSQSHLHLQQQHMQQQQLQQQAQRHQHLQAQPPSQQQQQQMVGAGISQTFIQGHGRSQNHDTRLPQAGPTNMPGRGSLSLEVANNTAINMPLAQQAPNIQQSQSQYVKIWEGSLFGQRKGQPVFICKLEGYRSQTASDSLAEDWPPTMQIVRLLAQEHMNNKQYVGKADFLVFRTLNQHGFLEQLREKKLCAVIQLPTQTLLLSVSDHKAHRLIGMLFPGDMVVFKPQVAAAAAA